MPIWFQRFHLDTLLLPFIGVAIVLGLWSLVASHAVTKVTTDDWGDKVTITKREGLSADLPNPAEAWAASKPYILEPFAKRGEMDQGILRFTWYSLVLVAKGYALALLIGAAWGISLDVPGPAARDRDPRP